MNLNLLMEQRIEGIMKTAGRLYLSNPRSRAFFAEIVPAMKKSAVLRRRQEARGFHVPPFLIASIASQCNLRCAGCYARAGGDCTSELDGREMGTAQWRSIFSQASELGVSFLLLAGGEPFLRRDVLELAAEYPRIIFPVFTNGTLLDEDGIALLDQNRNLIPVLSLEGGAAETDSRRGAGTHARIEGAMRALREREILFGASITVTRQNLEQVTEASFAESLRARGCGLMLYVEYVPAETGTEDLVLRDWEVFVLQERCHALKKRFSRMVILSFPGDEQAMGGCLASGRGFFHINPRGDAEPCPFSPYAKRNLRTDTIAEVLQSDYFESLRQLARDTEYRGGCTLFHHQKEVEQIAANNLVE